RTPISSNVVTDHLTKTWIFVGKHVDASLINQFNQFKEVEVFQLDTSAIALVDVLNILHKRELRSVYVEGGATVNADRKSTRLNSSHVSISYAVFCLKKKINT